MSCFTTPTRDRLPSVPTSTGLTAGSDRLGQAPPQRGATDSPTVLCPNFLLLLVTWTLCCTCGLLAAGVAAAEPEWRPPKHPSAIRVATFNVSLNRNSAGKLESDLMASERQAADVATVIRAVKPDILLLNEIDYTGNTPSTAHLFEQNFLAAKQLDALGSAAWPMPHIYVAPVNTGDPSGLDLNQNGKLGEPDDSWGFGRFPGQYGMAVLSRFPIKIEQVRTLQNQLWSKMPGALRPQAEGASSFYPNTTWNQLRIPSKSFWDVPIQTEQGTLHVLASHPTPPAFDGPEDRNGCRNHDEIRLIADYIDSANYLRDDAGGTGGLDSDAAFVVLGDLNSDPNDGGSRSAAIQKLIEHPRMAQTPAPTSPGARDASERQGKANLEHQGDPSEDTADFSDSSLGNLRVDYVLPSRDFKVHACGVFWPKLEAVPSTQRDTLLRILRSSDHHLVWADLEMPQAGR